MKNADRGYQDTSVMPPVLKGIVPGDHEKKSGGEKCIEKQIKDG
ncbi:hypothetical protein CBFG_03246 [Clostridiales bacterium 1_7_47FAA]|nr:hypothetical protein CBFG_03246 [Clostridiales bacterium 1_7_47FAA]